MRIGILALLHESNTFIEAATTIDDFAAGVLAEGEAVREHFVDTHHEVGGFFAGLAAASRPDSPLEAVPIFAARAVPSGTLSAKCFDELLNRTFDQLDAAGTLDGLLVAPHGATVSEEYPDADGHWLAELRRRVGLNVPIVGTLDPHANLSAQMVASCQALIAYRSNPHLDQRARGIEAAELLAATLRGEVRPEMAARFPPLAINIERQLTSESQCRPVYELADEQLAEPVVLSNSVLLGFPYADVPEMGSAVLAVTDNDVDLAEQKAAQLAATMWERRHSFAGNLIDVDAAVTQAASGDGPVCLLDMGDNVGGGSPADGTYLLHALLATGAASFGILCDPAGVETAATAGVGGKARMSVGGKTDDRHGPPLEAEFEVLGLYDGLFKEPEPRHGGFTRCNQGPTAVCRTANLTVMLTSRRMPPFSLHQLSSCNVDPAAFQVLVAKGVNAPVAAYAPVCTRLIRVNTPGVTTADMASLVYNRRRRPLFPLETDVDWTP